MFPLIRWSLGTLIYEMLTGLPPFYSQNINIMYQKILNGELRFPSYVTGDAQNLLEGVGNCFPNFFYLPNNNFFSQALNS